MTWLAADAIQSVTSAAASTGPQPAQASSATTFVDKLEQALEQTSDRINQADAGVARLALGQADSLHGVMIALEQAKLSLGLMVQVRNKLVDAYQEMLRMQI